MVKWYVIMKIWNENDHIRQTLDALDGYFDNIFVLDGAYSYFPYKHSTQYNDFQSTDGTIEAIEKLMDRIPEIILHLKVTSPWNTQVEKMNTGIISTNAKDGDYVLFMDGHEFLEGDFPRQQILIESEQWNIGKIVIYDPDNHPPKNIKAEWNRLKEYHSQWRILRYHKNLAVINKHWNFNIHQHGELDKGVPDPVHVCEYIRFQHPKRNPERDRLRDLYKHSISPFRFDENEYIKWRDQYHIEDGHSQLPQPSV